jgi:predicted amidohydrolase YtcJ
MRILYNASITTNDPACPRASALAIDHGRIMAVGSDEEILDSFALNADKENLEGKIVWPGLTDAHIHLEHYAINLTIIDCEVETQAEVLRRVAERVKHAPQGSWILGHGWNQNLWSQGFGTAENLDTVAPDHPVYLTAKSLHAGWANSAALRQAGISSATSDLQDGQLLRDPQGKPTGILLESAMELVDKVIPPLNVTQLVDLLRPAQHNLWKFGLTGVHDFDQARCFSALQIMDQAGELGLRVVKSIPLSLLSEAIGLGLRTGFGSEFLRIGSVKLFTDGALGPHTAAMFQPYEDDTSNSGILFLDREQIFEYGQQASSGGISMAIHAIGDRANHEVLDAYTQLRDFENKHHLPHLRHRIEHVQCLHPADLSRLAGLSVIASVQPIHAISDMLMADRYWGSRSQGAYAYHSLLAQGTHLAFGSDAPVESPNPFLGIHAAVTRRRPDGTPGEDGWYPEQRLALEDALAGFTTGPAFASGQEKRLGRLVKDLAADLIVLPTNMGDLSIQDLYQLHPTATMVNGSWVWRNA